MQLWNSLKILLLHISSLLLSSNLCQVFTIKIKLPWRNVRFELKKINVYSNCKKIMSNSLKSTKNHEILILCSSKGSGNRIKERNWPRHLPVSFRPSFLWPDDKPKQIFTPDFFITSFYFILENSDTQLLSEILDLS